MKTEEYFKKRLILFDNLVQIESGHLTLDSKGEVFNNYVSLKPIFKKEYWNNIQVPLWFVNTIIEKYMEIADKWYEIAKIQNKSCRIYLIIYDPDYVFSELTVDNGQISEYYNRDILPDKFVISKDSSIIWEKIKNYDEKSWHLDDLTRDQMKDLLKKGYELMRQEDSCYNGKIYDVGDMIFRKEIGDKWIGYIKNNC